LKIANLEFQLSQDSYKNIESHIIKDNILNELKEV